MAERLVDRYTAIKDSSSPCRTELRSEVTAKLAQRSRSEQYREGLRAGRAVMRATTAKAEFDLLIEQARHELKVIRAARQVLCGQIEREGVDALH